MRRREFIALFGGAATWSTVARAQQVKRPTVGLLSGVSLDTYADRIAAVHQGLKENGFIEGQNLALEYRTARSHYEQLPILAAELARLPVAVIISVGTSMAARAAKSATKDIPIVFVVGADPVAIGLVTSLNRPDGNITGVTIFALELTAKRLELLREIKPNATDIAYVVNSSNAISSADAKAVVEAGRAIGCRIVVLGAKNEQDIDAAMATVAERKIAAVMFQGEAFFAGRRDQIIELAKRHLIPVMYPTSQSVAAGGLISYASDIDEMYRMAGVYVARILQGARPPDLPILQPTKFRLSINLKTARALGLTIPVQLLAQADEIIN